MSTEFFERVGQLATAMLMLDEQRQHPQALLVACMEAAETIAETHGWEMRTAELMRGFAARLELQAAAK